MKGRILNIAKVKPQKWSHGKSYEAEIRWAGYQMGSRKLGFNVTVLPPGKRAFPFHAHLTNEELFFVLEGRGTIRIGRTAHRIGEGDFISLPPGPASAHQIVNTSNAPLRYLAVSTMEVPEVADYPESGKLGVFTGTAPGRPGGKGAIRHWTRRADGVDYWDGED